MGLWGFWVGVWRIPPRRRHILILSQRHARGLGLRLQPRADASLRGHSESCSPWWTKCPEGASELAVFPTLRKIHHRPVRQKAKVENTGPRKAYRSIVGKNPSSETSSSAGGRWLTDPTQPRAQHLCPWPPAPSHTRSTLLIPEDSSLASTCPGNLPTSQRGNAVVRAAASLSHCPYHISLDCFPCGL